MVSHRRESADGNRPIFVGRLYVALVGTALKVLKYTITMIASPVVCELYVCTEQFHGKLAMFGSLGQRIEKTLHCLIIVLYAFSQKGPILQLMTYK